jgi:CheY-like chemotaxis protein
MLRVLLGEEIEVRYSLAEDLWPILGDRTQMHQVLLNLGVNARDAMQGRHGRLLITTGNTLVEEELVQQTAGISAGPYAWLEVTDTGSGIDHETLQHIFEPFFSTKGEAGTGLGLATVYGIVKQAGGGIRVTSEPGAGSTFTVFLPRAKVAANVSVETGNAFPPPMRVPVSSSSSRGQRCLMVVEDQDDVRGFAKAALEAQGYLVLEARTGDAALAVARFHQDPIDLLVTDVVLGEMSGREVSERVLALHPEARVLFTSGYPDDEIARRGVSSGSVAFLAKPYSAAALAEKVAQILAADSAIT